MENIEADILSLGSQNSQTATSRLQELITKRTEEELENIVKKAISGSLFPRQWDILLKAFQDTSNCHPKRIRVILTVLNELEEREVLSSRLSSNLVQRLCMHLSNLKTEDLVQICNFCLNSIQSKKVSSTVSWKDLLPDTLRTLTEQDTVEFNELEYSGQEFKTTFINTLCMSNWCPNKITQIAAMFSDMPLSKEEHLKVVNKLACYIEKLTPQEVPPFVYQLLSLCRHQNSRAVFLKLQHYFGLRIYSNANFSKSNDSESTPDIDMIENAEDHDALDAESTVLFHIQHAASVGHNCIKDYLNSLKNTVKSPDFILHPFQLLALFTISTVDQYEETVFDIIRHSIVRCYHEQQKKASSYWYRDIITSLIKPEDVFAQIVNLGNKEFLLEAFVNFGFALLGVGSALGRDIIAEKQWTLGTMILLKVIKKKRNVASIVLNTFCSHISTRSSVTQYLECLYFLSKSSPLLLLENQSCVVELIESLIQIPGHIANQLLEALIPLTKVSPAIRDHLLLILRKCLFSRSVETRQVAVYGYVKLISTLRISNSVILSQNSSGSFSSGCSLYTQISLNRTTQSASTSAFSSEAICWEVLGILKRCFIQQAEVKSKLYDYLYHAVCVNPELGIPVLDVLWFHFMEYYVMDDESVPPLNLSNVAMLRDTDCVLQEPLGKFIFTISQIVAKVSLSDEGDRENPTVEKYTSILNSLCTRMTDCDLVHFELDDGTDITDILPESGQKMHILKEVINIFEALMGYKVMTLSADNENQCGIINSLFQGYSKFLHFGKNLSKPKKGKKTEKLTQKNSNKMTQKTAVKDTQSQSNSKKVDNAPKTTSKQFKTPDTLLDLGTVEKGLKTLLETNVPWATTNDSNTIRTKADLHRHFVQAAIFLIGKQKNYKSVNNMHQKNNFDHITSIAETLYKRVIKRLSDYIDFDCTAAVSSIECFHAILNLINGQFKKNLVGFLSKVGEKDKDQPLIDHLKPLLEEFQKLFETEEDELSSDPDIKRLSLAVLNNITTCCSLIPSDSNVLSVQVYDWLKQIAYNSTIPIKVAGGFMNLLCETHIRYKSGLAVFEHASNSFCDIYGKYQEEDSIIVEETNETLKIVNAGSANAIVQSLCSYNKNILEDVESMIVRIKSDYCIITYSGEESDNKRKDDLKAKEKGVTCQLCFMAKILTNLVSLALPPGNLSDAIFKNIVQFYSALTSLTKYFIGRSTKINRAFQAVWFEKLVKLTGKRLAPTIYGFIYQLEAGQNKEDEPTQAGKKKTEGAAMKSKVLRETKAIPKVVYEMEQFSKYIIQLSSKTKYDLSKYVGQGTSRDFRINADNVQDELRRAGGTNPRRPREPEADTSREITDDEISATNNSYDGSDATATPPPAKKLKR